MKIFLGFGCFKKFSPLNFFIDTGLLVKEKKKKKLKYRHKIISKILLYNFIAYIIPFLKIVSRPNISYICCIYSRLYDDCKDKKKFCA